MALVIGVIVALGSAWALGLFDLLRDPGRAAETLRALGVWGYVLYVVSFACLEPFFVPGALFAVPAAMIWPKWLAFTLSLAGSVGAGLVGFGFARFLARDWVSARLPDRLRRFDEPLAERGLRTVIVVRLLLFLAPPAHWGLGLSRVRFVPFVLGTAIGFIPGIAALTWLGGGAAEWIARQPAWTWAIAAIVLGAVFAVSRIRRRNRGID